MASDNTCFGIYRFEGRHLDIFDKVVRPLVETHTGLTYVDARRYYEAERVKIDLILEMVDFSDLVVADISEISPNVFLEIGFAFSLKKKIAFICTEEAWKTVWKSRAPFDLQGRDIVRYSDEKDLKVKLSSSLADSLYRTEQITCSWAASSPSSHVRSSSQLILTPEGATWSDRGINYPFTISYVAKVQSAPEQRGPDIRLLFAISPGAYPQITCIFPWERVEREPGKAECHIDYMWSPAPADHVRLQQVSVCLTDDIVDLDIPVAVSFSRPNVVFESTVFDESIDRLVVPISQLRERGFDFSKRIYVGFIANTSVLIDQVSIREIHMY